MAWRRTGDEPLHDSIITHFSETNMRPWVWNNSCMIYIIVFEFVVHKSLQWRHNGRGGLIIVYWIVYSGADHRKHQSSASLAFVRGIHRWPVKLRVTGLCTGNSPVTGEFPAQMASNAEYVSIWWRHHVKSQAQPVNENILHPTEIKKPLLSWCWLLLVSSLLFDLSFLSSFALSSLDYSLLPADFDRHVNKVGNPSAHKMSGLLQSCGLEDHINVATHVKRNALDHISDEKITILSVSW